MQAYALVSYGQPCFSIECTSSPFFWEDFVRIGEVNLRLRRYRHNFHSFALSDKEEDILNESKKITGQGLTDTLMSALKVYVKNNMPQEKEDEPKSHLEFIREFFFPNKINNSKKNMRTQT